MAEGIGHIGNFGELCAGVQSTLARRDLSAEIPSFIANAEIEMFRDCDIRPADQVKTGTIAPLGTTIPIPKGALDVKNISLETVPPVSLKLADLDQIIQQREVATRGPSRWFHVVGDDLWIAPAAGAEGTTPYTMVYYGLPEPLSEKNPTNALLRIGWDVYLYGALMHSAPYIGNDERLLTWGPLWTSKKASLKLAYWRARFSGILTTRPDVVTDDRYTTEVLSV